MNPLCLCVCVSEWENIVVVVVENVGDATQKGLMASSL